MVREWKCHQLKAFPVVKRRMQFLNYINRYILIIMMLKMDLIMWKIWPEDWD